MDFVAIVIFLVLYYIRPQEWIGFVTELKPVKWSIVFALLTMVFRERGFHLRDLVRTPHDWLMLAYFAWIVLSNPALVDTFNNNYNLFVFYLVTVQALSNIRRLQAFLGWWMFMILVVAALAVAAPLGFDLVGSNDLTEWRMKGRLVFNTSIFNNPNALGHSIYPAAFLLYFLLFWKRPVFLKIAAIAVVLLPLWCVYLTVSKGAFIGIFVTTIAALTFGRPKAVQILVLVGALTFGWTVLWSMPRMSELQKSATDQAIQGRIAAFKFGLDTLKTDFNGIGIHQFVAGVERAYGFKKAAHSSYVQVGGELGWPGLILFVSLLYACARTLFNARTTDVTEERVRRALFVLLVSYSISSWMVNWPWRTTFFLMVGAVAAFHRLMLEKQLAAVAPSTQPASETPPATPLPAAPATGDPKAQPFLSADHTEAEPVGLRWNKLGWVDGAMVVALTWATVRVWQYLITRM